MQRILSDMQTLSQYLQLFKQHQLNFPEQCPHCYHSGLWRHGHYPRKADRSRAGGGSLNPIPIQRFFCCNCHRTCSVLPECIPPRRWYLWSLQQIAFLLWLAGKSFYAVAKELAQAAPSRHTIKRWVNRFQEQFHWHKDTLCHSFIALGRALGFVEFWPRCLSIISLSSAMRLCHVSGVVIP